MVKSVVADKSLLQFVIIDLLLRIKKNVKIKP